MAGSNRRFPVKGLIDGIRLGLGAVAGVLVAAVLALTMLASLGLLSSDAHAQSAPPGHYPPRAFSSGAQLATRLVPHPSPVSQSAGLGPMVVSGTWQPLVHQPPSPFTPESAFVLTDGRILAQDGNLTNIGWWTLTPQANTGSYVNGMWTQVASPGPCPNGYPGQSGSTVYSPLYYGSAVLADGRLVVIGGEYNYNYTYIPKTNAVWTDQGAIYDPVANSWTCIAAPSGWLQIGDAQSVVLDDGTFMIAHPFYDGSGGNNEVATLDASTTPPTFNTPFTPPGKTADYRNDEEGWTLLPNGEVLTLEIYNSSDATETPALAYDPLTMAWDGAGTAPNPLVDTVNSEIGPAVLRPDGTLFAEGATAFTDIYDTMTGDWSPGPGFPTIMETSGSCSGKTEQVIAEDAPAALLPDGNVLLAAGPIDGTCAPMNTSPWIAPTLLYEFDGSSLTPVNAPPAAASEVVYNGRLLLLPSGQVMWTDGTGDVEIYTPMGTYNPAWAPTITVSPIQVNPGGKNYPLTGTQFNGLSQAVGYGDDYQGATNYPLVRITNKATGHVFYARTHDHSTMGVATGATPVTTEFDVPSTIETGPSTLVVVANGIPSQSVDIAVGPPANDLEVIGSVRVELAHSSSPMSDELNMDFSFEDKGPPFPACGSGTDAIHFLAVELEEGTCASLPGAGEAVDLSFVSHTVGDETYGTDFYNAPGEGGGAVSARIVKLVTPLGTCGAWTLNLELSGLDLDFDSLGGGNPFALLLEDGNGNTGCFDVTDAIVGNQIDPPREVRRDTRR